MISLSDTAKKRIDAIKALYPDSRSALMPTLSILQEENGYIDEQAIKWIAENLNIPPVHVMEVASFYSMYFRKATGRYHIQVCRTLSCSLRGAKNIAAYLKKRFDLAPLEVSSDGMWSYEEVECLGSCGSAPVCRINDCYFENLSEEQLELIIQAIGKEKPDLRFSLSKDTPPSDLNWKPNGRRNHGHP